MDCQWMNDWILWTGGLSQKNMDLVEQNFEPLSESHAGRIDKRSGKPSARAIATDFLIFVAAMS